MNKRIGVLVAVGLSFMLAAAAVYAQQTKGQEGLCAAGQGKKGDKVFAQLDLTLEHKQKLQTNRQAQREQMEAIKNSLKEKRNSLQEALKSPGVTRESAQGIVDEIKALQARQADLMLGGIFAVKEILTPEQFVKFQQFKQAKSGKMKKAFRRHGHSSE
ncbi:MAG: periplasmic heavy metal sensor, partial [Eubacteriales bacterium]|nr:periplasmic heavy metal sensor [Eubacteriales bacterium]